MKAITPEAMRELDRQTIEHYVTGTVLMERAGRGVAQTVLRLLSESGGGRQVGLFAGPGNNGGDAYVAARILQEQGCDVRVVTPVDTARIQGDALHHFRLMQSAGIEAQTLAEFDTWLPCDVLVDALLGTGAAGAPRGAIADAVAVIQSLSAQALVLSVDMPSGLDGLTGAVAGSAVRADVTLTIGLPKPGLMRPQALPWTGAVEVLNIGFPDELIDRMPSAGDLELLCAQDVQRLLKRRPRDAHKGRFGRILLIGGAEGYSGAITLASRAAVRSGAGLVHVVTPTMLAPVVAVNCPEAMVKGALMTDTGSLVAHETLDACGPLDEYSAILVGPGLTRHDESDELVNTLLNDYSGVLVLDADAVALCRGRMGRVRNSTGSLIFTPHPGELATMLEIETEAVQEDRRGILKRAVDDTGATVVLKGAGTLVQGPDGPCHLNLNGNPGLAKGGSGDVLAGLICGLAAQGLSPEEAACCGVWLHGAAADIAARAKSEYAMCPSDVISHLPDAFRRVAER